MVAHAWFEKATPLAGAPGVAALEVGPEDWAVVALDIAATSGRLLALWAESRASGGSCLRAAYAAEPGVLLASLALPPGERDYHGLHEVFPAAGRMQRAVADLSGLVARGGDPRPWLRHAAWPAGFLPLADAAEPAPAAAAVTDDYPFVRVTGDGVHEIAVGPVHAGIIEPGHFRFSVVGEKVLRLEERLGYVHKGIEKIAVGRDPVDLARLAGRVSGDSTVAHAWAASQAMERATGGELPPRAATLRALLAERERIANHLGDIGAICNDVGFAFAHVQCARLRELWQRRSQALFGHRLLMDVVVPGGVARDLAPNGADALAADHRALRKALMDRAPGFRASREAARAEFVSLLNALRADPFDPVAVGSALAAIEARNAGRLELGRSLIEADLRRRTGATLVAFTRESATAVHPSPDDVLQAGDILTLVGSEPQLAAARELITSGPEPSQASAASSAADQPAGASVSRCRFASIACCRPEGMSAKAPMETSAAQIQASGSRRKPRYL